MLARYIVGVGAVDAMFAVLALPWLAGAGAALGVVLVDRNLPLMVAAFIVATGFAYIPAIWAARRLWKVVRARVRTARQAALLSVGYAVALVACAGIALAFK